MSMQVALVRGINVGGHNKVAMSDLRSLLGKLGFSNVTTVLQSGNLVFQSQDSGSSLEPLLETETRKRLGISVDYIVRSAAEWGRVIARNPFPKQAKNDPSHLVVMFLKNAPAAEKVAVLKTCIKGPEVIHHDGRHLYITYPAGIGRSKLTGTLIEQKLGCRGTARNWNTILKLAALCK